MNRRKFLQTSLAATASVPLSTSACASLVPAIAAEAAPAPDPGVAILMVDTDRSSAPIDKRIYGQFLEHINHSIEDGLFAEQIRGAGFEGTDYKTYWTPFSDRGQVDLADITFHNGKHCVRLHPNGGHAGIRQGRIFLENGVAYDGFLWLKLESGRPQLTLRVLDEHGTVLSSLPLQAIGDDWHEIPFRFTSQLRDEQASIEIRAEGKGSVVVDFVSLMRADTRHNGKLRPDLFASLQGLQPSFIRWPGGSYASTYKWKECIGPYASRGYHPNLFWGGYSGYGGFGTDEFLAMCGKLGCDPLIVLACPDTKPESLQYAMDWVHYVNDPPITPMGRLRAENGHPEPYNVRLFQIDNEPMNNGFTPASYAEIVNLYGSRLRQEAPSAKIIACGQKRSVDMDWSETVIDLAGSNFDILGCHNYEYEPGNFQTGLPRLREYLSKLRAYVGISQHPHLELAVLEWSLQHTYDWRAGLHAAGSLMMYEELSPNLTMTCPALLMRNITDDPKWTSSIYHNHVTWFPGGSYPVQKLFREHFAERYLASATGSFATLPDPKAYVAKISTGIPAGWQESTVDAIATSSADGRRIVIKAVNYQAESHGLLIRLSGKSVADHGTAELHTIAADPAQMASIEHPDAYPVVTRSLKYAREFTLDLPPHSVAVLEMKSA